MGDSSLEPLVLNQLSLDDLYVATTFAEMQVVPEPTSLCLVMVSVGAGLLRRRKA